MAGEILKFGDRVMHALRPEWGAGIVTTAEPATHDGQACQRVTVRFDRAGIKTLSTAMARLVPADSAAAAAIAGDDGAGADSEGWLSKLEAATPEQRLTKLPPATSDPFQTIDSRLKATLDLYKFAPTGGSLLDWASLQTGLKDPLSEFNRHELEALFQRFAFVRDEHLRKLALELKKQDAQLLKKLIQHAPHHAQQVLMRYDALR